MTAVGSGWDLASDAELITAVRAGDSSAFGVLYERHAPAARSVARQYSNSHADAEDAVADAFSRVFATVRTGGGPDVAFRAYLFTVLRRVAMHRIEAGRRAQPTDDVETFEAATGPGASTEEPTMLDFERGVVSEAFRSLPERWQAVLWYTEVERMTPADIAPVLGLTPNGVAALAYRAREGLRQAYLQQHLAAPLDDACRIVNAKLGSYVRGGLAKRETALVESHLDECLACRALVLELTDVNHGMRVVIAPLVLGAVSWAVLEGVGFGGAVAGGAAGAGATVAGGAGGASGVGSSSGAGASGGAGGAGGGAGGSVATVTGSAAGGAAAGAGAAAGTMATGGLAALLGGLPLGLVAAAIAAVVTGGLVVAGATGVFSVSRDPGAPSAGELLAEEPSDASAGDAAGSGDGRADGAAADGAVPDGSGGPSGAGADRDTGATDGGTADARADGARIAGPTTPGAASGDRAAPGTPSGPPAPSTPGAPPGPGVPGTPPGPSGPAGPPGGSTGPTGPGTPGANPADPTGPGPSDPTGPTDPSDPADPADPTGPTDPSDPTDPTDPTDPGVVVLAVTPRPGLQVSAGEPALLMVDVTNTGTRAAAEVRTEVVFGDGLTWQLEALPEPGPGGRSAQRAAVVGGWTCAPDEADPSHVGVCVVRDLGPGESTTLRATVVIDPADLDGETTLPVSVRTWAPGHGDRPSGTPVPGVLRSQPADVRVADGVPAVLQAALDGPVVQRVDVPVRNAGGTTARGVRATVAAADLPPGLVLRGVPGDGWTCLADGTGGLACTADLGPRTERPLGLEAVAPATDVAAGTGLLDVASAVVVEVAVDGAAAAGRTTLEVRSAPAAVVLGQGASVSLEASVTEPTATTVVLPVRNAGATTARDVRATVTLDAPLPEGVILAARSPWDCTAAADALACSLAALAPGAAQPLELAATAGTTLRDVDERVTLTLALPGATGPGTGGLHVVSAPADLHAALIAPDAPVTADGPQEIVLEVRNDGGTRALGVPVALTLPAPLTSATAVADGWSACDAGLCRTADVPADGTVEVTVAVAAADLEPGVDEGVAVTGAVGGSAVSTTVRVVGPPRPLPAELAVLVPPTTTLQRGVPGTVLVTVRNDGGTVARDVEVDVDLPGGVFAAAAAADCTAPGGANRMVTCRVGDVLPGAAVDLGVGVVTQGDADGAVITAVARHGAQTTAPASSTIVMGRVPQEPGDGEEPGDGGPGDGGEPGDGEPDNGQPGDAADPGDGDPGDGAPVDGGGSGGGGPGAEPGDGAEVVRTTLDLDASRLDVVRRSDAVLRLEVTAGSAAPLRDVVVQLWSLGAPWTGAAPSGGWTCQTRTFLVLGSGVRCTLGEVAAASTARLDLPVDLRGDRALAFAGAEARNARSSGIVVAEVALGD